MQTETSSEVRSTESSPNIDRWTRPAIAVVAVCLLVYVFDVYELTTFQVALPAILGDFHLTLLDAGVLLLITAWVGRVAGLVLVPLADAFGRRTSLALGVLGYSVLTGFTGLAQNFLQFGVAATATRIPITAGNFPSTIMATEAAPRSGRALAQGLQTAGYPVGFVLVSLASVWLLPLALVVVTVPLFATYGMLTDYTALFVVGLVLCSLFLAPFGQGTWGWVMEIFPTECRATGFSVVNFVGGAVSSFYALIPAVMHSVGASFPIFAAGYAFLAIGFLLLNETIREDLLELVGERAGAKTPASAT